MTYLIIAVVIAALISPFMVLKPSQRQKTILTLRELARQRGLQVQVMAEPVRDGDGQNPASMRYYRPWRAKDLGQSDLGPWLLVRDQGRGQRSPWRGWRWVQREAPLHHQGAIANVVSELPDSVNAVSVDRQGIGVYWQELNSADLIDEIDAKITKMYDHIADAHSPHGSRMDRISS